MYKQNLNTIQIKDLMATTPVFSICEIHGYIEGEHEFCPKCDEEILKKELKDDKFRIA